MVVDCFADHVASACELPFAIVAAVMYFTKNARDVQDRLVGNLGRMVNPDGPLDKGSKQDSKNRQALEAIEPRHDGC